MCPTIEALQRTDPEIARALQNELRRQRDGLELIAAENYVSTAVLAAMGSVMTNKYAEGYPGARHYGGCQFVDEVECLAIDRARRIFHAEHANVQAHSGTQANMAVFFAAIRPGDTVMGMNLAHGGHLSHGSKSNFSGVLYNVVSYGVDRRSECINMDEVRSLAKKYRPRIMVAGASSYPRFIDFKAFAEVAAEVGAYLFVDIAHTAGLVAADLHPSPVPYADFVTLTTHKTMRGPRGGIILCPQKYADVVDRWIFPGTQGGPFMHIIAGKAVALQEALLPSFNDYQKQILKNCQAMLKEFTRRGYRIVSGGSDNHLFLIDLRPLEMTGTEATEWLDAAGITVNRNHVPFDSPKVPGGIRIGTPALTTRKMKEDEMVQIADWIDQVIRAHGEPLLCEKIREDVRQMCERFPIYESTHYA